MSHAGVGVVCFVFCDHWVRFWGFAWKSLLCVTTREGETRHAAHTSELAVVVGCLLLCRGVSSP